MFNILNKKDHKITVENEEFLDVIAFPNVVAGTNRVTPLSFLRFLGN